MRVLHPSGFCYNPFRQSCVHSIDSNLEGGIAPHMISTPDKNATTEHALYLRLFITAGGGW
jgi:hypothetical protein